MSSMITRPPEDELAYEQIEAAVKETSRGRWFLEEFARRQRNADTLAVLGAIEALQRSVMLRSDGGARPLLASNGGVDAAEILDLARIIAKAQADVRSLRLDGDATSGSASDELDAVIATTEHATSTILSAAERVQEQAWTMREAAVDTSACDALDSCATEIYQACAFQDLTAQRIRKMVDAIHAIDGRLTSILKASGLEAQLAEERDALQPEIISRSADDIWMSEAHQIEIDETFEFFTPAAVVAEPTIVGADLLDLAEPPRSMDEILSEARRELVELNPALRTPAETDEGFDGPLAENSEDDAVFAPEPAPAFESPVEAPQKPQKMFRLELNGPGTPDHDEMLDGIVDQPAPAAPTPVSPFAEYDALPLAERIRAFR